MFVKLFMLAAAAQVPPARFEEYIMPDVEGYGWAIEKERNGACSMYSKTQYGIVRFDWRSNSEKVEMLIYNSLSRSATEKKVPLNIAFQKNNAEVARTPNYEFVVRTYPDGAKVLVASLDGSTIRANLLKSDRIWVLDGNAAKIRSWISSVPLIFKSLDACLAGKSRS